MNPDRIATLRSRRNQLAAVIEDLRRTPEDERPTKPSARKAWERELASCEELLVNMDTLLKRTSPPAKPVRYPAAESTTTSVASLGDPSSTTIAELGRIPKGKRAEMRVSVKSWKSRRTIDIRLWFIPEGGTAAVPSRKGVSIDASKIDALLDALHQAKQHV